LKQLKIIHKEGFSDTEIDQFRDWLPIASVIYFFSDLQCPPSFTLFTLFSFVQVQSMQKILKSLMDGETKISSKRKVPLLTSSRSASLKVSLKTQIDKVIHATELSEDLATSIQELWALDEVKVSRCMFLSI
jgi:hypothetical protein